MDQTDILHEMNDKLTRVESALLGDEKFGSIGLVKRVGILETKTISKSVAFKWSLAGLATLISTVVASIKYFVYIDSLPFYIKMIWSLLSKSKNPN